MLALSTFSIPVADTANRLTVTFILLLTAVAVRLGLSGTIRNITHLTLLVGGRHFEDSRFHYNNRDSFSEH